MYFTFIINHFHFIIVIQVVIPAFSVSNKYTGFLYTFLGHTPFEVLKALITHPIEGIKILFINHTHNIHGDYVKLEFHIFILLSGLYLLFKKPAYLIMLVPLYAQKMFHDSYIMWGISGQYVVEFAPILAVGTFSVLAQIKNKWKRNVFLIVLLTGTIGTTIRVMDHTILFTNKASIRFYQADHYHRNYDVEEVYNQLNKIPENAKVSVLSPFVPHLAMRENIYQFPIIKDADYIVFSPKENHYPITKAHGSSLILSLEKSKKWVIQYKSADLIILKKSSFNK